MKEQLERTAMLIGEAGVERLAACRVAVFGIGGVGGYAVEALARVGIGSFTLIDPDTVSESNINRQLMALHSTVGKYKTEVAAARVLDINPTASVLTHNLFFLPENAEEIDFSTFDYVVDAVDTVAAKLEISRRAAAAGVPVVAAMGTGNKLVPTAFRVANIEKTEGCPLARTVRGLCRREGIRGIKAVFSTEQPTGKTLPEHGRNIPGSISFVPAAAGLLLARTVVADLLAKGD